MAALENYKGQWCFIEPRICQKELCKQCGIYLKISRIFASRLKEDHPADGLNQNSDRLKPIETFI